MAILERQLKSVSDDAMQKHLDLVGRFEAVETRLGFPPARWYSVLMGSSPLGTRVMEREWPSLAAMEEGLGRAFSNPEWQALAAESGRLGISTQIETLMVEST